MSETNAATSAKHLLKLHQEGRYRADSAGDIKDIQATAAGHTVRCPGGQPVHIDERVMRVLVWLIEKKGHTIGTSAICSDHHFDSPKGHAGGFSVDISSIDGDSIATASARAVAIEVDNELHKAGGLVPRQLITGGVGNAADPAIARLSIPSPEYYGAKTMSEHCNHIHVGY